MTSVIFVGHCMPDSFMLKSMVRRALPDAETTRINSSAKLNKLLDNNGADILLINRALDGTFDVEDGNVLIEQLATRESNPAILLISNFEDALARAEAAGAMPGFGKSELNTPKAAERLQAAAQ